MADEKNPVASGQRETTWERLKKTIFDLRITVIELWGLIAFIVWISWYIYSTYKEIERKVENIEVEMGKQSDAYKSATENMQQLLQQFDKRLDQTQNDLESLKK